MEERRRFVRLDTRLEVSYTKAPSGTAHQSMTKDISGGGICLFTDQVYAPGTRLSVSMKLPGRAEPVRFTAEVVWNEQYEMIGKESRQRSIEAGVRFVDVKPEDRAAILQHVILGLKPPAAS